MNFLANERGVAALMGIIFALIIIGTVAFNFVIESRQKQSGSSMTYTSTNALMIAEAGLRYTQKCLLAVDVAWGCPTAIHDNNDWTTITSANNFNNTFAGDGNFAVSFPVNASNDSDNIFVVSTGTFRGAQRSLSRFISRVCVLGTDAITSCVATTTNNNSSVDPPLPDPPVTGVCPTDPPGIVAPLPTLPSACGGCPNASCPNFTASHLDGSNYLTQFTFCDMIVNNLVVKTKDADTSDNLIVVAGNLEFANSTTVSLSDNAVDPNNADDTVFNVYGDVTLKNLAELNVKGAVTINTGLTFNMENSSKLNNLQGDAADASIWVEGDATVKNSALLIGSLSSDGTILLENNAEIDGALFGSTVTLKNNATLVYSNNQNAGSNTSGYSQCVSGTVAPNWSE
jgi:hypothetical protein